jgi:hypothetical protein
MERLVPPGQIRARRVRSNERRTRLRKKSCPVGRPAAAGNWEVLSAMSMVRPFRRVKIWPHKAPSSRTAAKHGPMLPGCRRRREGRPPARPEQQHHGITRRRSTARSGSTYEEAHERWRPTIGPVIRAATQSTTVRQSPVGARGARPPGEQDWRQQYPRQRRYPVSILQPGAEDRVEIGMGRLPRTPAASRSAAPRRFEVTHHPPDPPGERARHKTEAKRPTQQPHAGVGPPSPADPSPCARRGDPLRGPQQSV